jgi:hypothetical protein
MVDDPAARKATELTAQHAAARKAAEDGAKMAKKLVEGVDRIAEGAGSLCASRPAE